MKFPRNKWDDFFIYVYRCKLAVSTLIYRSWTLELNAYLLAFLSSCSSFILLCSSRALMFVTCIYIFYFSTYTFSSSKFIISRRESLLVTRSQWVYILFVAGCRRKNNEILLIKDGKKQGAKSLVRNLVNHAAIHVDTSRIAVHIRWVGERKVLNTLSRIFDVFLSIVKVKKLMTDNRNSI